MFRLPVVLAAVALLLAAPVAESTHTLSAGGYRRDSETQTGVRATLSGSSTVPSNGVALGAVRVQSGENAITGMLQTGVWNQGTLVISTCGPGARTGYFAERKSFGSPDVPSSYTCHFFPGAFGTSAEFKVARLTANHTWAAYRNNVSLGGPWNLGFNIPSHIYAIGEWVSAPTQSFNVTYGPSGTTPWQVRLSNGTYATINIATPFDDFNEWGAGALPSPFAIFKSP
jgi:hypothetical protein